MPELISLSALFRKALICKGKDKNKKNCSLSAEQTATVAGKGGGIYAGYSITHGGGTVTLAKGTHLITGFSVPRKTGANWTGFLPPAPAQIQLAFFFFFIKRQ